MMEGFTKRQAEELWLETYNSRVQEIGGMYKENALFYTGKGNFTTGNEEITRYYIQLHKEMPGIKSMQETYTRQVNDALLFEMGELNPEGPKSYKYVRMWEKDGEAWRIGLEVICGITFDGKDHSAFDSARKEWVRLSNGHDQNKLVRSLYAGDAVYYDRVNVYRGWDGIASVYSYMSEPGFSIDLFGRANCHLQPDLAYEIGEYHSNGYEGSYIIIWERQADGEWKISLDSNS